MRVCTCAQAQRDAQKAFTPGEGQILPMMARAAAAGGGVEYDKYEVAPTAYPPYLHRISTAPSPHPRCIRHQAMIAEMSKVSFGEGDTVFNQGDLPTHVYFVTSGRLVCEHRSEVDVSAAAPTASDAASSTPDTDVSSAADAEVYPAPAPSAPSAASSSAAPSTSLSRFDTRVVATLGPGDHFGETAMLEVCLLPCQISALPQL